MSTYHFVVTLAEEFSDWVSVCFCLTTTTPPSPKMYSSLYLSSVTVTGPLEFFFFSPRTRPTRFHLL